MCCAALGTPSNLLQGRPNFLISVDKGPSKEHCSRTRRLNFSNVALRYTSADAIEAVNGARREPRTGFQVEATSGIFLIAVPQLVLKGSFAG
jgi:hypothetical protein